MDAKTCMQKLQYVGVLAFATVDEYGNPQVRNISAIHYEPDAMYFFTARGKDFCKELLSDGRVQILGYTRYKEMIRLAAKVVPVPQTEQGKWIDTIFSEQCMQSAMELSGRKGIRLQRTALGAESAQETVPSGVLRKGSPLSSSRSIASIAEIVMRTVQ